MGIQGLAGLAFVFAAGLFFPLGTNAAETQSIARVVAWASAANVPAVTNDVPAAMGLQVLCLAADPQAGFWAGTESDGLWRFDPRAAHDQRWRRFTTKDGLGENHVTALCADSAGRIWAGHGSCGVSVFDGAAWRAFGAVTGPLGARVHDIRVDRAGRVWMATDLGLSIYSDAAKRWFHLTTRNGLPENAVQSVAFDDDGHVFIGLSCEGIVVGTWDEKNGLRIAAHHRGPELMPIQPRGAGLPSSLINTLLVATDGTVYAGTPAGLAASRDQGATWTHWRGANLWAKILGRYLTPAEHDALPAAEKYLHFIPGETSRPPDERAAIRLARENAKQAMEAPLLADDWVYALTEDVDGRLWVGYRQKGVQVFDPKTMTALFTSTNDAPGNVRAILPGQGHGPLLGCYNDGLRSADFAASGKGMQAKAPSGKAPSPASPPTAKELEKLIAEILNRDAAIGSGNAVYLGADWQTRGDWVGKYGRQDAEMYGHSLISKTVALRNFSAPPYVVGYRVGPNGVGGLCDVFTWLSAYSETHSGALYNTYRGCRRIAESNDGSFQRYTLEHDGPDLWLHLALTAQGLHRVSLYFSNGDAHTKQNGFRDFVIEVRRSSSREPEALQRAPVVARCRVRDFYNGVYEQFLLPGGQTHYIRIVRNHSFVTKIHGVFIDKLSGPVVPHETTTRLPGLADIYWGPADTDLLAPSVRRDPELFQAATKLWDVLRDPAAMEKAAAWDKEARLLAYRAAAAAGAHSEWLRAWRWQMGLWDDTDREGFRRAMRLGWESYAVENEHQKKVQHRIWDEQENNAP